MSEKDWDEEGVKVMERHNEHLVETNRLHKERMKLEIDRHPSRQDSLRIQALNGALNLTSREAGRTNQQVMEDADAFYAWLTREDTKH